MDNGSVAAAGIGGVIASIIAAVFVGVKRILAVKSQIDRRQRKDDEEFDRRTIAQRRDELDEYINRLQADLRQEREQRAREMAEYNERLEEERQRTEECRKEHLRSEQFRAEMMGWAGVVEQILARHRIKIPRFPRESYTAPGSGTHRSLPQEEGNDTGSG